jgi:uncharacterized membrane protein HdeD (DUF308 family)
VDEGLKRRGLHRVTFALAAVYNLAWGLFTVADPQWFFRFSGMAPLNHPEIYACLGMVVGVYGIVYAEVARRPEHGWLMAAVGFLGKVLGPLGMLQLVATGVWPVRAASLCLTNDLVWWFPFALYLKDAWPLWRRTWRA